MAPLLHRVIFTEGIVPRFLLGYAIFLLPCFVGRGGIVKTVQNGSACISPCRCDPLPNGAKLRVTMVALVPPLLQRVMLFEGIVPRFVFEHVIFLLPRFAGRGGVVETVLNGDACVSIHHIGKWVSRATCRCAPLPNGAVPRHPL